MDILVQAAQKGESVSRVSKRLRLSEPDIAFWPYSGSKERELTFSVEIVWSSPRQALEANPNAPDRMTYDEDACLDMLYQSSDRYCAISPPQKALAHLVGVQRKVSRFSEHLSRRMLDLLPHVLPHHAIGLLPYYTWVENAIDLERAGKREQSLDVIFAAIDDLLLAGKFDECDKTLRDLAIDRLTNAQLLTVLTATLPAKSLLPSRAVFFDGVKSVLENRKADAAGLMAGLE